MIRPVAMGPRSFTRTSTVRPFLRFVTRSRVPNGRVRCAAVSWRMSYVSPLAVFCPWCCSPYQDACPVWTAGRTPSGGRTTSGGRVTFGEGDTSGGGLLTEVGDDTQPATVSTRATPAIRQCSIEPLKVSITAPTRFGKPKQSTALIHGPERLRAAPESRNQVDGSFRIAWEVSTWRPRALSRPPRDPRNRDRPLGQ